MVPKQFHAPLLEVNIEKEKTSIGLFLFNPHTPTNKLSTAAGGAASHFRKAFSGLRWFLRVHISFLPELTWLWGIRRSHMGRNQENKADCRNQNFRAWIKKSRCTLRSCRKFIPGVELMSPWFKNQVNLLRPVYKVNP